MIGEILWRPGGPVTRQISRRGADHHPIRRQVASHQILLMDLADTDRQIEPLIHQIDHPVSQIQFHLTAGQACRKVAVRGAITLAPNEVGALTRRVPAGASRSRSTALSAMETCSITRFASSK